MAVRSVDPADAATANQPVQTGSGGPAARDAGKRTTGQKRNIAADSKGYRS